MNRLEKIQLAIHKGITCNPETGEVFGIKGTVIKTQDKYRRIIISFKDNGKRREIKAHQFIWYCVNRQVVDCIDHINRNPSDNRISNLRELNYSQNSANNGAKGYSYWADRNKYRAQITHNYKCIYLGLYNTEDEAREAYLKAKKHYFPTI